VASRIISTLFAEKIGRNQLTPGIVEFASAAKTGGNGTAKDATNAGMELLFLVKSATQMSMLLYNASMVFEER